MWARPGNKVRAYPSSSFTPCLRARVRGGHLARSYSSLTLLSPPPTVPCYIYSVATDLIYISPYRRRYLASSGRETPSDTPSRFAISRSRARCRFSRGAQEGYRDCRWLQIFAFVRPARGLAGETLDADARHKACRARTHVTSFPAVVSSTRRYSEFVITAREWPAGCCGRAVTQSFSLLLCTIVRSAPNGRTTKRAGDLFIR